MWPTVIPQDIIEDTKQILDRENGRILLGNRKEKRSETINRKGKKVRGNRGLCFSKTIF
ncbi:hypothetical protein KsCSTR_07600 [Candidatus Kuenenia stuttgartiensis]|jgi:hypothetical protein|nr:hypothetical protein KsCSTR_07600 [Candidatus Kuenenia stuttgartiensis]